MRSERELAGRRRRGQGCRRLWLAGRYELGGRSKPLERSSGGGSPQHSDLTPGRANSRPERQQLFRLFSMASVN